MAAAQSPATGVPARSSYLEVTPQGAFVRESNGILPARQQTGAAKLTAPGLLWSHPDGGLGWIGTAVSIGDVGGQVFAEYDLNNEAAELFSSYDSNPPTAVWSDGTPLGSEARTVDSAAATNTHVSVHSVASGPAYQAVVSKYSSDSATPDWTYTMPPVTGYVGKVAISRDGQTIVAAVTDDSTWNVDIAVFGPGSGIPVSYTSVPVGTNNGMRGFDLSADGSTLYFSSGATANVFDVATATPVFSTSIGASFDSHAISGDGSVFAFGNFNIMRVWERTGPTTYVNTFNVNLAGSVYCGQIDISDDSSTVAFGWYYYATGLQDLIEAYDIPSQTRTMHETLTGTGGYQNLITGISCSADGSRFAAGLWGDQGGMVAEVRIYDRDSDTPIATYNTPGSVFDIDLSADGQRVVAGSKAVHANQFGNGGYVDLLDAGGEDFIVRGTPTAGGMVDFELHGTPGDNGILLTSPDAATSPITYPGIGTLYIKRMGMSASNMGVIPAGGIVTSTVTLPAAIGADYFYQGLTIGPRTLTTDWVKTTLLP